eukprot:c17863_g1_i2 orf=292-2232(+)
MNAYFNPRRTQMDLASYSTLPPPNTCFSNALMSEFESHLSLDKCRDALHTSVWQASGSSLNLHFVNGEQPLKGPLSPFHFDEQMIPLQNAASDLFIGSLQNFNATSEHAGSHLAGGNWRVDIDHSCMVPISIGPVTSCLALSSQCFSEGDAVRELVGRQGSNVRGKGDSSVISSASMEALPFGARMEEMLHLGSNWSSENATTSLHLTNTGIQGANVAALNCLVNMPSGRAFIEPAATFPSLSTQEYSVLAPVFPLTEAGTPYPKICFPISDKSPTQVSNSPTVGSMESENPSTNSAAIDSHDPKSSQDKNLSSPEMLHPAEASEGNRRIGKVPGKWLSVSQLCEGASKQDTFVSKSEEGDISTFVQEETSNSEPGACETDSQGFTDNPAKKRKRSSQEKLKETPHVWASNSLGIDVKRYDLEESKFKPHKIAENGEEQKSKEPSNSENSRNSNPNSVKETVKPPEAPKQDYIHVRARRGQATDSHSLAERVRREKISERMKFLQDLVPGCSKVTGKAVMLDKIINYVQSLQRQVEFLSMKLTAMNPRIDFDIQSIVNEMIQQEAVPSSLNTAENTEYTPLHHPSQISLQGCNSGISISPTENALDPSLERMLQAPLASLDAYSEYCSNGIWSRQAVFPDFTKCPR